MLLVALLVPWASRAQLADYSLTTGTTTYTSIANADSLLSSVTGDAGTQAVAMPFNFPFGEDVIAAGTNLTVRADGYVYFGTSSPGHSSNTAWTSATNYSLIAPLITYDGKITANGATSGAYKALLPDGNGGQMLVIEFKSVMCYYSDYGNYNFQLRLYPSGRVEAVYGTCTATTYSSMKHNFFMINGTGDKICVTGSWTAPVAGSPSTFPSISGVPASGTVLTYTPPSNTCPKVASIDFSGLTSSDVTISWTPTGTESVWLVSLNGGAWLNVNDTTLTIDTLTPNTLYSVAVRSYCDEGDTSNARTASFRTACEAIAADSLPWTYGFEDATGSGSSYAYNQCMGRYTNYTSTAYPYPSSTNKHTGTYGLYFYSTSSYYSYVTLPLFEEDLDQLQLSFWVYRTNTASYGHYMVGVMTDPGDLTTFDTLAVGQAPYAWEYVEVPLAGYTGTGRYLAILSPNMSAASYVYIDDIKVDYLPTCYRPTAVDTTEVTPTSATFSITHDQATTFMVLWHRANATTWDTLDVSGTTFTLTGLTPGLGYEGRVYTVCGSDTTDGYANFSVTAGCSAITADDLPYREDFESYGSGAAYPINGCWTKRTNSTTAYPYPSSTAITGSRSLYFYGYWPSSATSAKTFCWAALPPVDDELDMSDLMVSFNFKRGTTTTYYVARLYVGIADSVTGLTDTTAMASNVTWIDTIDYSSESTATIHAEEVSFDSYDGTGKYVVFYAPVPTLNGSNTYGYNAFYIDDIALREIPSCYWPSEVVVDSVSTHSVTLSWTPDPRTPSPDSWTVEYGPEGFADSAASTLTSSDTTITVDNLNSNTRYEFHVMANCGSTLSDYTSVVAATDCEPIPQTALPWTENFDAYPTATAMAEIPCWRFVSSGTSTSSYVAVVAANPHSSPNSIRFNGYCPTPLMAVLPPMENVGALELSMWLKAENTGSSGSIRVGYITVPTDTTTFVQTARFEASEGTDLRQVTVTFPGAPDGAYIAIQQVQASSANYWWWADDIEVHVGPSCPRAQSAGVATIGSDSVEVVIVDTNEVGDYIITLKDANDSVIATYTTSDTSYTISGLTPQTNYTVSIVTDCGDGTYTAAFTQSFRTACTAIPTDSLPYIESFQTYSTGSSASISPCWTKGVSGSTTQYPYPTATAVSGSQSLYFYSYKPSSATTAPVYSYAALPAFEAPVNTLRVKFKLKRYSSATNYYTGYMALGVMSNPNDISTFDTISVVDISSTPASSIHDFEISLAPYQGEGSYIAFMAPIPTLIGTATYAYNYIYLDSVAVDLLPSCYRPENVAVGEITASSVDLSWYGNASSYEVEYADNAAFTNSTTIVVNDTATSISNLNDYTTYWFRVRGICNSTDSSEWSAVVSAVTLLDCGDNNINIIDTIGHGTSTSASYAFYGSTSYPRAFSATIFTAQELNDMGLYSNNRINGIQLHSGTTGGTLNNVKIYMAETQLDVFAGASDTLNRNNMTLVYSGNLVVPTSSWIDIPFNTPFNYSGNSNLIVYYVRDGSATAAANFYYTSTTNYYRTIYFYVSSSGTTYSSGTRSYARANVIFNICTEVPSCLRPANVTVNNIEQTSATVHWTSTATNFEVEYGPAGFVHGNGIVVTTTGDSLNITGLTNNTQYDVYVRALCSATDISDWSVVRSFTTACGLSTLPLVMDFENEATGTAAPMPNCWMRWNNSTGSYNYYPYVNNTSGSAHSGTKYAYFYFTSSSGYSTDAMLITPEIDTISTPMNTIEAVFWAKRSSSYTNNVYIGVVENESAPNTSFIPVDTIALTATYTEYTVSFANYTGYGNRIAFRGTASSTNYIYLDDIVIEQISECERAYNLTASHATQNSVELGWTDTISSTSWVVSYKPDTAATWTEVTVTSNPYTLTGLTPFSRYEFRVAPICASGDRADWSRETKFFRTSQVPAAVPYSYDFEDAAEWQNWTTLTSVNNATRTINWYRGTAVAAAGNYSMYLSTDGGTTHSWDTTVVTNAVAFRDIDFGSVPHSYEIAFDALMGGATDAFYDGIIVFTVDPAEDYEVSTAAIHTPWGNVNDMDNIGGIRHNATWTHHELYLDGVSGVKRLVFYHFNNTGSHQRIDMASAIDNLTITMQTCERPGDLAASDETLNGATLTWAGDATALYQVAYRRSGAAASTNILDTVRGTSYVVTNAQSSSTYNWWVRKICTLTATDTVISGWSNSSTFTTLCGLTPLPYSEGFEGVTGVAYNAAGVLPSCWDTYSNGTDAIYTPHVVGTGTYANYPHTGTNCLGMVSSSTTTYGNTNIAVLPPFVQPISNLRMSFWYRMESATSGTLSVGYITDITNDATFVPLKTLTNTTTVTQDSVFFDSVQNANARIAFQWYQNGTWYTVGVDDIEVWSNIPTPTCNHPENVVATNVTHNSATLTWTGNAEGYEVAIMQGEWVNPNAGTVVANNAISYNNLVPGTVYNFGVRAICDDNLMSDWEVISFTTAVLPCYVPTNLAVNNVSYTSAQVSFTPGEAQTEWVLHLTRQGVDRYDTVNTTTATITGLVHGTSYQLAVRAICSNENSPWSDTISFSTVSCDIVQGVTVTNITGTTALVSWTSTGAAAYVVACGYQGSGQGEGTLITVSTNSVVLTGLETETSYDVYVRSVCGDGIMSVWSSAANFTTTSGSGPEPTYYTITVLSNNNDWGTVDGGGSFLENSTVSISASANQGYHFVQWQDGNTDNPRSITVTGDMTYTATFAADNVGIDQVSLDDVSLFPNPATSTVTVRANGMEQVSIIDLNGRTVMTQRVNTETATFDLGTLAKGTYFVRIVGQQASAVRKLVVK